MQAFLFNCVPLPYTCSHRFTWLFTAAGCYVFGQLKVEAFARAIRFQGGWLIVVVLLVCTLLGVQSMRRRPDSKFRLYYFWPWSPCRYFEQRRACRVCPSALGLRLPTQQSCD